MSGPLLSILQLLVAAAFLETGDGLQGILIPVRGHAAAFTTNSIGLLGSAYYLGFVLGCMVIPSVMRRVGHIRAFSGFASLGAAAFLVHQMVVSVWVWLALRVVIGFCFAGLYMALESWLNEQATVETRGRILAAYMIVGWIAVICGKLLFAWSNAAGFMPFALVSIAIGLAGGCVAFTTETMPKPAPRGRLRLGVLYRTSPVGLVGCLCVGMVNGAFWSLAPIYAGARVLSTMHVALFISAAVLGGALTQWPLGKWSDRIDRRWVIALISLAAAGAAGGLVPQNVSSAAATLALSFLFGASALPLYAICVAHANDMGPANSFVEISGDLLMTFGIGAIIGPYLAALAMTVGGDAGLFVFIGVAELVLAAFAIMHIRKYPVLAVPEKAAFVAIPRTTQAALPLDPRSSAAHGGSGT